MTFGNKEITKIYFGQKEVIKIYFGQSTIYTNKQVAGKKERKAKN